MLTKERIEALLKINTKNKQDCRAIRIMSCDNPIKELFIYELGNIKNEFNEYPTEFEKQLALCIYKFDKELNLYLNKKPNNINIKNSALILNSELIKRAISELNELHYLLSNVVENNVFNSDILYDILNFKPNNYIAILQICGLVDISNDIFRSKILSRILNIKEQIVNYKNGRMKKEKLIYEFEFQLQYISSQLYTIENTNMYEEDFLIYVIMFDIRPYKAKSKNKILKNWIF